MTRLTRASWPLVLHLLVAIGCGSPKTPPTPPSAPTTSEPTSTVSPTPPPAPPTTSEPTSPITSQPAPVGVATSERVKPHYYNRVVVLGIGVAQYQHIADKAEHAERDAEQMLATFRERYGFETRSLIGQAATRQKILAALDQAKAELSDRDVLIVYFAGHGQVIDLPGFGSAGYLIPFDAKLRLTETAQPDEWAERAIDMHGLTQSFQETDIRHVLFIVDACCSGFMTRRGDFPARSDLQELMLRRSRSVLAATTDRRPALPDNKTGHGFFTGPLLAALKQEDAQSVTELFLTAQRQTVIDSKRAMLPQRGEFGSEYGELVFIPKVISAQEVAAALKESKDGK